MSSSNSLASTVPPAAQTQASSTPTIVSTESKNVSSTLTSTVAFITVILGVVYLLGVLWIFSISRKHPRTFNKKSGKQLQVYAPFVYVFMVINSLVETSCAAWLLLQYHFHGDYPNVQFRTGTRMIIFSSCWTFITSSLYTLLFLHPTWSKYPISSIGTQFIWIFITWTFWIIGAVLLDCALPSLLLRGNCTEVVYCGQIRTLFALSIIQVAVLTGAMVVLVWLARQSLLDAVVTMRNSLVAT